MSGSRPLTAFALASLVLAGCSGAEQGSWKAEAPASSSPRAEGRRAPEPDARGPSDAAIPAQHTQHSRPVAADARIQPGTLTAGSLDDHARFDEFSAYLAQAVQNDRRQALPSLSVGLRAVVQIVNEREQPISDARVTIRAVESGALAAAGQAPIVGDSGSLLEMTTGADGRVVFLSGLDAPGSGPEFVLTVTPPDGGRPVTQRLSLDQAPWRVTLPQARRELPRQLDLALIIDTTGSMADEINYLKVEIDHIAAEVHARFPHVDQRFGLVLYRDQGDEYVTRSFDFTASLSDFRRTLAAQSAGGGGDEPEAMHLALEQSVRLSWRGAGTARVAFLVADAPPHSEFAQRTLDAAQKLRRSGVTVFPVGSSGVGPAAEFVLRAIGFLTQGQYLFLTDHSGVGNPHAKPQASSYAVEKLDQLMVRMIAEKLSGQSGLPQDVIAVEEPQQAAAKSLPAPLAAPQPLNATEIPTVSIDPPNPAPAQAAIPKPTSEWELVARVRAALAHFEWGAAVQTLVILGIAALLIVVERLHGV